MATNTTNLNLVKPADNESYSVPIVNANMDKIDAALGKIQYVYKGGLNHITGETMVDKFRRAYEAGAFPISQPFVGYISAGTLCFVAGYLYMSSNAVYGSGIICTWNGSAVVTVNNGVFADGMSQDKMSSFTVRSITHSYTAPAGGQYNVNLKTLIDSDLPSGYSCLGIAGYTTNEVDVYVVACYYGNTNWSLQLKNLNSAQKTNNCIVHYLCAKV